MEVFTIMCRSANRTMVNMSSESEIWDKSKADIRPRHSGGEIMMKSWRLGMIMVM